MASGNNRSKWTFVYELWIFFDCSKAMGLIGMVWCVSINKFDCFILGTMDERFSLCRFYIVWGDLLRWRIGKVIYMWFDRVGLWRAAKYASFIIRWTYVLFFLIMYQVELINGAFRWCVYNLFDWFRWKVHLYDTTQLCYYILHEIKR